MTTSNNTQKLFTTGQLIGLVCLVVVISVVAYMAFSGDWSGFNSVGLGK